MPSNRPPLRRLTGPALATLLCALLAVFALPGLPPVATAADQAPAPASPQASTPAAGKLLALVGGRLIDGYGGPPISDSVVLDRGRRITAVGRVGELAIPPAPR